MIKFYLSFFSLLFAVNIFAQSSDQNIAYVVDSILVEKDPDEGDDILQDDIADMVVVGNKDSLIKKGFGKFDKVIYLFTKEYRKRPDSLKKIPSTRQMTMQDGIWYLNGKVYNGRVIDYYYSGKKHGECVLQNGKVFGKRIIYYPSGNVEWIRTFDAGIKNGLEQRFYEGGDIKQAGNFKQGKQDGVWKLYYPNNQIKQLSEFKEGTPQKNTMYYSNGKVIGNVLNKNGREVPLGNLAVIDNYLHKASENINSGNVSSALKNYAKIIETDSTYAEVYFVRGTTLLNDFKFDEALKDFDRCLHIEPLHERALANRAFTRIRKHQYENGRMLKKSKELTVMASPDHPKITPEETTLICNDLQKSISLGNSNKMVREAHEEFCNNETDKS